MSAGPADHSEAEMEERCGATQRLPSSERSCMEPRDPDLVRPVRQDCTSNVEQRIVEGSRFIDHADLRTSMALLDVVSQSQAQNH